ncbi:hypothetical protein [Pseudodesulfovibrio portus]|uniref:VPLPA-CTERM protein sorting domain-containing protein n=1 Tax=Pseudodesulfovibrio portus TaxID=231439 RepID=A0ABN6RZD5_9BACT|nr:hypothetical protein [Pseudodesulfovibrio portus]BDQ35432.1 hypothetical protein JCM14722_29740 [Pseudodesulfovibrio portus]
MKRLVVLFFVALFVVVASYSAQAATFSLVDTWGGSVWDANKTQANTDDDLMCWAAAVSNMLTWTNWSAPYASNNSDAVFSYYQSQFTDVGGNMYIGADWWFDGTNNKQGVSGWSQDEDPNDGGGGFYPSLDIDAYYSFFSMNSYESDGKTLYYNDPNMAMNTVASYMGSGMSVGLGLGGSGSHAVTAWGYSMDDTGLFSKLFISDSDDGETGLMEYTLTLLASGYWELTGYGSEGDSWYITEVHGLAANPTPIPGAIWLLGSGLLGLAGIRRRFLA